MAFPNQGNNITITVNPITLIKKLRENREKHIKEYEEAKQGYQKFVVAELQKAIADVEEGKILKNHLTFVYPKLYSKSYDVAIDMLRWHNGYTIELSHEDFSGFVRDEWDWSESAHASNTYYAARAKDFRAET